MPAHPDTGVDPVVDRFAVWREDLQKYTDFFGVWPNTTGEPVEGQSANLKRYKRTETEEPEHDHRFYVSTEWAKVDADPVPPSGHPAGQYLQIHTLVQRPVETLKAQVESAFQAEVRKQFPDTENPSTLVLAAKALAKKQTGAVLTTDEQATLDAVTATGDAVGQLLARKLEFDAAIDADEDYDLTQWPQV